jgi:hypothetical protein
VKADIYQTITERFVEQLNRALAKAVVRRSEPGLSKALSRD